MSVPVASPHLDPRNPDALGYDADAPCLAAARRDADLAEALDSRLRRETARFRGWAEVYRRHGAGGVAFSGASAGAWTPVPPEGLVEEARLELRAERRRRERRAEFWRFTREMLDAPVFPGAASASLEEG